MKHFLLLMTFAGLCAMAQKTVLDISFTPEQANNLKLPSFAKIDVIDGNPCLAVTATEKGKMNVVEIPFDYSQYSEYSVAVTVRVKYNDLTQPKDNWNGTKIQATYVIPSGRQWRNSGGGEFGTADWHVRETSFIASNDISKDGGSIQLGLQDCVGTVWFDDLKVTVVSPDEIFPKMTPPDYQCVYTDRVKREVLYRGVMSPGSFSPETTIQKDLPDLKSWGANLIRWQLIRQWHARNNNQDPEEYLGWVNARIPEVKQVLDKCQELGIKVVLDLHVAPGGRADSGHMNMFQKKLFADTFEQAWINLSTAVKGHPALYAYDLINEPSQPAKKQMIDYLSLQYRVAKTVRGIDPDTPIIIESNGWDSPTDFAYLTPLPMKDIIYQAHMYNPGAYTHQGISNRTKGVKYPDDSKKWNKETMRKHLQPVRDFELKHGAKIYFGEFSAARWAEGAEIYLQDVIDIFEEYGWDWSYHAFRESHCWDVEIPPDGNPGAQNRVEMTARKQVLVNAFKKNK
ncbi:MAG: cellulase family glycosylhydrolase [Victivallales bacterium]|nr:cellulase family glycosylhydrolase [Victivallales bacterium]